MLGRRGELNKKIAQKLEIPNRDTREKVNKICRSPGKTHDGKIDDKIKKKAS